MGKKGSQAARSQEDAEPDSQALSGVFATDFPLLCQQAGISSIVVKPLPPLAHTSCPTTGDEPAGHCVFVDDIAGGEGGSVKAVHIRGWLLTGPILSALATALSGSLLKSINLWNVGLTSNTLQQVTELVQPLNLRHVTLDGNALSTKPLVDLLAGKNCLEHLSLKCCGIGDSFVAALCHPLPENKSLLSLDLSCNSIGDTGAAHLAAALRLNRTLLSLACANNRIGDEGAANFAKVLKKFPLSHNEIVKRRKLLSQQRTGDGQLLELSDHSPRRSPSVISLDKSGKVSKMEKGGKGKKDPKKEDKSKKEEKGKKGGSDSARRSRKESKAGRHAPDPPPESPQPSTTELESPLLGPLEEEDGRPCMSGNTTLTHLTLSHNRISALGVQALLEGMQAQSVGTGLLRLTVHSNAIPSHCEELTQLAQMMQARDPLKETSIPSTDDHLEQQ